MTTKTEKEKKEWSKLVDSVYDEIGRCLIHIEHGLFSANRAEALHAKVLQLIPKKVTLTDTPSIGFGVRGNGLVMLINPDFFLKTLSSTPLRSSALRLAEQHVFLMHPFRQRNFQFQQFENQGEYHQRLFHICAALEANDFISGYEELSDALDANDFSDTTIPKAASAETLYHMLLPLWKEMQDEIEKADSKQKAPDFSATSAPQSATEIHAFLARNSPSDQRHWDGEKTFDQNGIEQSQEAIDPLTWELLEAEVERILLMARETLDLGKIKSLPKDLQGRLDGILDKYNLKGTPPELAKAAEDEIGAIIVQMMLKDPFFGQFISGCVRQVTDTIPTAGVAVLKKYVALLVNPHFFMKELKNRAERAAVLKHEALHIMLKHIIQMRNPKFPNKRLYNIAADLEVNQYIGHPWKLPNGAILLTSFPKLKLPPNDVAETYYKLLQEEVDKNPNSQASKAIRGMCNGDGHEGGGHSDHRGWEEGQSLTGNEAGGNPQGNLNGGINAAGDAELDAHELDIERQVQQARDSLSSKQAGSIPGRFVKLLNDWMKARQPSVDWKRELRLFVSSNPSTTAKKSVRKKNKRYVHWLRQSLKVERVSADVINQIARRQADLLPKITWKMLPSEIANNICERRPSLSALRKENEVIPWAKIPLFNVLQIQTLFADSKWPSWDDISDRELFRLKMLRTPLDPDQLPVDLFVVVSKEYPKLLPEVTWDHFGVTKKREVQKQYPHLKGLEQPIWGLLPAELIVWLQQQQPDLFTLSWKDIPPQLFVRLPFYQLEGDQPYRIDRFLKRTLPGLKKERDMPKVLIIIDTSGSVSDKDIEYLFAEIDAIHKLGTEVHILQVDTRPCLYFKYVGEKPVAGRGGTLFEPAMVWLNNAREGVKIKVKHPDSKTLQDEIVKLRVDGAIYLTDGYAPTPVTKPYCRLMWVITPENATDQYVKDWEHSSQVIHLPPYKNR